MKTYLSGLQVPVFFTSRSSIKKMHNANQANQMQCVADDDGSEMQTSAQLIFHFSHILIVAITHSEQKQLCLKDSMAAGEG